MNTLKRQAIELATKMLQQGRQPNHVKSVTSVTIAEMARQGLVYEIRLPDPSRPGMVICTGNYRSVFQVPSTAQSKSNKRSKREDREGFFKARRLERKARMAAA